MRLLLFAAASSIHMGYWAEGFKERGHAVQLLTMHPAAPGVALPCPVEIVEPMPGPLKSGYLGVLPAVRRAIAKLEPDVTIAYYATSYGFLAALAGVKPLVVATAGSDVLANAFGKPPGRWLRHASASLAMRRADLVLAWADHMADAARGLGAPADRLLVQPRGVRLARWPFRSATPPEPSATVPLRITSTRSLRRIYRLDRIIDAAGDLVRGGQPVELRIFGEGVLRPTLEGLARGAGFEAAAVLPGHRPSSEVAATLAASHLYVSVAESDGLSHSLLEAMACGAYPVVSDHPSNRSWIEDRRTGHLVRSGDTLSDVISDALANPERRARAAVENRRLVEERGDMQRNLLAFEAALEAVRAPRRKRA